MLKNGMRPIHPGEVLREDFQKEMGFSAAALARALGVATPTVNNILRERGGISADMALRLAICLDTTPEFWLNLQIAYDLRVATAAAGEQIEREIEPMPKADRPKLPKVSAEHARAAALAASVSGNATGGKARRKG